MTSDLQDSDQAATFVMGDIRQQMSRVLVKARDKARDMLEQAHAEAQDMVKKARSQALQEAEDLKKKVVSEAHAEGYQAGLKKGQQKAYQELANKFSQNETRLVALMEALQKEAINLERRLENDVLSDNVDLCLSLAEHIAGKEGESRQEFFREKIKYALDRGLLSRVVKLRLHPDNRRLMSETCRDLARQIEGLERIELVDDLSLTEDDLILESDQSQFRSLKAEMLADLKQDLDLPIDSNQETENQDHEDDGELNQELDHEELDQPESPIESDQSEDGDPEDGDE